MQNEKDFRLLFFLLLTLTLELSLSLQQQDLNADRTALLALRSTVGGRTVFWNTSYTANGPCSWFGVSCTGQRVTVLRLPAASLIGEIPTGIFSALTELQTLSLRLNKLSGRLPADLGSCTSLRNVYLQGNRFSGEIPEFLLSLTGIVRLNLGENEFEGSISSRFDNLTKLKTLFLENNKLSGPIPVLKVVKLEQFNVSNNLLNGSIPERFMGFDVSSFSGNSLCGKPLGACAAAGGVNGVLIVPSNLNGGVADGGKRKKLSGVATAGIVIGSVLGFVLIALVLIFLCRKKGSGKSRSIDITAFRMQDLENEGDKQDIVEEGKGGVGYGNGYSVAAAAAAAMVGNGKGGELNALGPKKLVFFGKATRIFDLEDLLRASAEVLGKGTFGTTYKAVLEAGTVLAVKRLKDVIIPEGEFKERIDAVGAMDHENLVPLHAYYYSRDEKLLVYDYMYMGSLSALLHGEPYSVFCLSYFLPPCFIVTICFWCLLVK